MLPHIEEGSRRFFHENGAIVFEHFLTDEKSKLFLTAASQDPLDGFLQNENLKNALTKLHLGKCAKQLLKDKQYLLGLSRLVQENETKISIDDYSIVPVDCFAYLQLQGVASAPFPMQSNDIIFIDPKQPFTMEMTGVGILIGIANVHSQYILNPDDPHTNLLKRHGYAFGDRLDQRVHPLLK